MCIAKFNNSIGNSCVTAIAQGKTEDCEYSWHTLSRWAPEFNLDKLEEGCQKKKKKHSDSGLDLLVFPSTRVSSQFIYSAHHVDKITRSST